MLATRSACARLCLALALAAATARAEDRYQQPPRHVLDVLRAPASASTSINPTHDALLLLTPVRYPPIADLARPFLRLAGVRFHPDNRATQGAFYWSSYSLVDIATGAERKVELPAGAKAGWPQWSADGKRFVFTVIAAAGVELWGGEVASGRVRRFEGLRLNPILDDDAQWMPDQRTLLVKLVPEGLGAPPSAQETPRGPNVQEAAGEKGASSTYEVRDVLKSPRDEELFEYYTTSQLALADFATGKVTPLGKPAVYTNLQPAPGGQHLLVTSIHRPYSYLTTYARFPSEVEVWSPAGAVLHKVASLPLVDAVPIWGVPTGPREFEWRPTEPATLVWAEALDSGDWKVQVPSRDRVMTARAPFTEKPVELTRTTARYAGFWWGARAGFAFLVEDDVIKHWRRVHTIDLEAPGAPKRLVWDHSSDERYKDPGFPVFRLLPNGARVIDQSGDTIHLTGLGASPEGDRPFLDRLDLRTLATERLFRSGKAEFERFADWLDPAKGRFLTRRESPTEPPNVHLRTLGKALPGAAPGEAAFASTSLAVTRVPDPTPQLRGITKRLVKYKRADGVDLSFTLYLPPGYKEGTRLPTVVWAYPLDYADASMAGQVVGSPQRFTVLGWPLHLFFLLDGYAVIDNPSMPVVGDSNKIYDTYMEQLLAGAKAAVEKAVELGVTDRDRIGVTGHSHGGLMTVNLLAWSDLFRAGIARSGAYNRSLTAFGFQNERRTLWEATDVYTKVSPFFHAEKIKSPLLLIHGAADANPGTVPLQSELLFEAVRGNGGTAKLVMLPFESHGYRAQESIEHVLYESLAWFDKYVKHAAPRAVPPLAK
jgi:dipeptidyl aminopeptidase/acylaminoacyl peptidase